jgi:hypothetical protein
MGVRRRSREAGVDEAPDPRLVAAFDLLGRCAAVEVSVRVVHPDPETRTWPVVWLARGVWRNGVTEIAAAPAAIEAVEMLCERVIDGGTCTGCGRPAGVILAGAPVGAVAVEVTGVCWYRFDPEATPPRYLRGCESPDYGPEAA